MNRHLFRAFSLLALAMCWGSGASLVRAWDFTMAATFTSTYEYYSQQGPEGFFGTANLDRSTGAAGALGLKPGDFASLNGWVGNRARNLVSGADSSQQYPVLELFPDIRINPAIRFRGKYRLGDYGDPTASDYITNTRPGVDVATSDGQWTMWWITARTPWGLVVIGKRPEEFGVGLQYNGARNATGEGMLLVSDYGPFRIAFAFQPFWQEGPNQKLGISSSPYYNLFDKNGLRQQSTRIFMTYRTGPLDMGITHMEFRWRAGPESQNRQATRETFVPYDDVIRHGCVYAKYFNGTVFVNAEAAYWNDTINFVGRAPAYYDSWRGMAEAGAVAGPAKVSFMYAFMPGADRRHGAPIDRQPYVQQGGNAAYSVFQPYSFLLGYAYGGGVNAFDLCRQGYINEAWVLAGRADYAVAANFTAFGAFLWAERSSYGHGWGYIRPAQRAAVSRAVNATGNAVDQVTWTPYVNYRDNAGAPSIPDNALGWEATAGIDWKLLENLRLSMLGSYWRPGKWFNYACVDRSVAGWDVPVAGNRWGANPDRTIDPVTAVQVEVKTDF